MRQPAAGQIPAGQTETPGAHGDPPRAPVLFHDRCPGPPPLSSLVTPATIGAAGQVAPPAAVAAAVTATPAPAAVAATPAATPAAATAAAFLALAGLIDR